MLRGSLSARPLALQASGLAFGHPCAALGQCQAIKPGNINTCGILVYAHFTLPSVNTAHLIGVRTEKTRTMFRSLFALLFALAFPLLAQAQPAFSVGVSPFSIPGFEGVQSFVSATHNGYIVLLGGRKDGLHQRQPFASFAAAGNNATIHVLQPASGAYWSTALSGLPEALQEQLQSTNMQFHQSGEQLVITGGYGYSESVGDHITHALLTVADVPTLINAVINDGDLAAAFEFAPDARMAVTGGYLHHLQDTFYLVGGHKFTGRYNPHNGPSFVQEYTNQVRRFTLDMEGSPAIGFYEAWTDEMNLHRRDYNLVPQVFPGGIHGFTAFSGVFQHAADLPFLNSVDITAEGYTVNNDFEQFLNHYHCGTAPLYDPATGEMHTLFFGGMSQYYFTPEGDLRQDDQVPFVPTIGAVTRYSDGTMSEYKVGELPALLGAGSEFIPVGNGYSGWPEVQQMSYPAAGDSLFIGYLVGGIESSSENIFFVNNGTQSAPSGTLFSVYLKAESVSAAEEVNQPSGIAELSLSPNPASGQVALSYRLSSPLQVNVTIADMNGQIIRQKGLGLQLPGQYEEWIDTAQLPAGAYLLHLSAGQSQRVLPLVVH